MSLAAFARIGEETSARRRDYTEQCDGVMQLMTDSRYLPTARIARAGLAMVPWAFSLYLHYWLEHGELWAVDMPYRGPASVAIIALGMGLSFLLHSALVRRAGRNPASPVASRPRPP